ncbi:hypothetical protein GOHSU_53_00170 [Gordonia hirsuta DSM 44140 = NBRC 16056]|uniref:Two-component histidine kinase n=1 Tax=Gordonia hirsuta DSM 44140 = NBRC 16056 TaxID=1121927 RepID=L7LCG1_9ACTN|nr:hypothetical protein [Gordonia hirsuta]GAC58815.1 hypothetical protein GOHSU_53_00170 [Gordonia hirsuta DSM 44140 = NBRC 16056]
MKRSSRGIRIGDIRELLGLSTPAATILVAGFVVTFGLIAVVAAPQGALVAGLLAWVLVGTAALLLVRSQGDPLPVPVTAAIAAAGPIAGVLVFPNLPGEVEYPLQFWPLPATTALGTFLCVRGRTGSGWLSMLLVSIVCWIWAASSGYGTGPAVVMSGLNLAPMLMATFFALTIRPAARDLFELRQEGVAAAVAEASHNAHLEERDRQLVVLDERARPYLERLARPESLTPDERRACTLAEARLRDSLRAPILDSPALVEAVWRARLRGVEVILLDDRGLDDADQQVRERICAAVVEAVEGIQAGTVTVRVLPPGRPVRVTVVQICGDRVSRREFDQRGAPIRS